MSGGEIWPDCPFWNYSLSLYRCPGVEKACLSLQRRHDLDVNLLLLACWLASRGIELDRPVLSKARQAVTTWQVDVVRPLRNLRHRLRIHLMHSKPENLLGRWTDEVANLRDNIKNLELDGEHLAQLALSDLCADLLPTQDVGAKLIALNKKHRAVSSL